MPETSVTTKVTMSDLDINDAGLAYIPYADARQLIDQAIVHHISVGATSVPNVRIYDTNQFNVLGTYRVSFGCVTMTIHDVAVKYDAGSDPMWERHLAVIFTINEELDKWPKDWQDWLGVRPGESKNHCLMYYIFARMLEKMGLSNMVYSENFETAAAGKLWDAILQANIAITRHLNMKYNYTYDTNCRSVGTAVTTSAAFAKSLRDKLSPEVELRVKVDNTYMDPLIVVATVATPEGICQRMRIINRHYADQVDTGVREASNMVNQLADLAYPGAYLRDNLEQMGVYQFITLATMKRHVSACRIFGDNGLLVLISIESGRRSDLIDYNITDRREDEAYRNEHKKPYTGTTDLTKENK